MLRPHLSPVSKPRRRWLGGLSEFPVFPVFPVFLCALWMGVAAATVQGCIVSDRDLPCRRDCECPSGQTCSTRGVCGSGSTKPVGDADGKCQAGDTCTGTLLCLRDEVCGDMVCRQRCSRLTGGTECPPSHVCEDIRTGDENPSPDVVSDGGILVAEGACVP